MGEVDAGVPGQWYEIFTRDVYQALVAQSQVRNVEVKHDVKIRGRSGALHQIDVFWEFDVAGTRYRTCVECKCYKAAIKKTHIASFATIVEDIGNATGIFVTSAGYQSGAELLAKDRNIRLVVLNPVIRTVKFELTLVTPEYRSVDIQLDLEACKPIVKSAGRSTFDVSVMGSGDSLILLTATGERRCTLNELVRQSASSEGKHSVGLAGYFIGSEIGPLPLKSLTYEIKLHNYNHAFSVESADAAKAVIDDVLANSRLYLHEDGTVAVDLPKPDDAG